jgi:hypothetical protein
MAFGSKTAVQYDVGFNVLLGPFRAQLGEAAGIYERTTGQMSTDALRLSVRQADLAKAIERYGAESTQAARKTIALRDEMASLGAAAERNSVKFTSEERALGRYSRGALAAAGVSGELRRAALLGSVGFIGAYGLVSALEKSVKAATDAEATQRQLGAQLKASGLSLADYRDQIDKTTLRLSSLAGFTADDLTKAFTTIVRGSGNVSTALRDTALAADIARGRNVSLETASVAVGKAAAGSTTALRRLGIELPKGATGAEAIAIAMQKFAGQAQAGATAGERFSATLHDTEVIIGEQLLPIVNRYLIAGTHWLQQMNESGKLQRDVGRAVHDFSTVVHDGTAIIHAIDKATGSFEHTLELLLALKLASTVGGWRLAFARLAGSEGIGAAETAAGGLLGRLTALQGLGAISIPVTLDLFINQHGVSKVVGDIQGLTKHVSVKGLEHLATDELNLGKRLVPNLFGEPPPTSKPPKPRGPDPSPKLFPTLGETPTEFAKRLHDQGLAAFAQAAAAYQKAHPAAKTILGLTDAQQTALLRAQGTPGTADDVQALNVQLGILQRLVQQKGLNAAQLNALLQARDSVLSQIDALTTKTTNAIDAAAKKAAEARKKKAAAAAKALLGEVGHRESVLKLAVEKALLTSTTADDIKALDQLIAFYKHEADDPKLSQKMHDVFKAKAAAEQLKLKKLEHGLTDKSSLQANEKEFLDAFMAIQGSYGSNVRQNPTAQAAATAAAGARLDGSEMHGTIKTSSMYLWRLMHMTDETNRHLRQLVSRGRFPEAEMSRRLNAAAFDS